MSYSYIAESYAGVLTKTDVLTLFGYLVEKLEGNRSHAAREAHVTGKATYDWGTVAYLKTETKLRVLDACLRLDFRKTIEFLLSRCGERTTDILRTVLFTIQEEALLTTSIDEYKSLLNEFEEIRIHYRGVINDSIPNEFEEMQSALEKKAAEFDVPYPEKTIQDLSIEELLSKLPLIKREFEINARNPQLAIQNLRLPPEIFNGFWTSFDPMTTSANDEVGIEFEDESEPMWGLVQPKISHYTLKNIRQPVFTTATASSIYFPMMGKAIEVT
jgi:hypothetical protein